MATILCVAGHGKQPNGWFDSGATGLISKGEHNYMREDLFPAMRKYLPDGHNVVFFDTHDCYGYGDIVAQARKYGNDTIVCEFHYDAGGSSASGGHVIIHSEYSPDHVDMAIVNCLDKCVGLASRYHNGVKGVSGRTDLANVMRTYFAEVNYRLIEVGYGTNQHDVGKMTGDVDNLARELVLALCGKVKLETDGIASTSEVIEELQNGGNEMLLIQCEGVGIALLFGGKLVGIPNFNDVFRLKDQGGIKVVEVSKETYDNLYSAFGH